MKSQREGKENGRKMREKGERSRMKDRKGINFGPVNFFHQKKKGRKRVEREGKGKVKKKERKRRG